MFVEEEEGGRGGGIAAALSAVAMICLIVCLAVTSREAVGPAGEVAVPGIRSSDSTQWYNV
jgi:hypothetical protein